MSICSQQIFWQRVRRQGRGAGVNIRDCQPLSRGHHLVGFLILRNMHQTLHTRLYTRRKAPHNSAVACQCSNHSNNHSNNKLRCHLVGMLKSYWRPLLCLNRSKKNSPKFKKFKECPVEWKKKIHFSCSRFIGLVP